MRVLWVPEKYESILVWTIQNCQYLTWPRKMVILYACTLRCFSHDLNFETLWTVARQTPLSMGFSRQEYWSGLPCPRPGDLPHPGIELASLYVSCTAGGFFTTSAIREALIFWIGNSWDSGQQSEGQQVVSGVSNTRWGWRTTVLYQFSQNLCGIYCPSKLPV